MYGSQENKDQPINEFTEYFYCIHLVRRQERRKMSIFITDLLRRQHMKFQLIYRETQTISACSTGIFLILCLNATENVEFNIQSYTII